MCPVVFWGAATVLASTTSSSHFGGACLIVGVHACTFAAKLLVETCLVGHTVFTVSTVRGHCSQDL